MSRDRYQIDRFKHGGIHIDRYSPTGRLVGRYRPDKSPVKHMGKLPPKIPVSDYIKFQHALSAGRGDS